MTTDDKILIETKEFVKAIQKNKERVYALYEKNSFEPISYWISVNPYVKGSNSRKEKNIIKKLFNNKKALSFKVEICPKKKNFELKDFVNNTAVKISNKDNGDLISFILNLDNISDIEIKSFYTELANSITGKYEGEYELIPLVVSTTKHNFETNLEKLEKYLPNDKEAL